MLEDLMRILRKPESPTILEDVNAAIQSAHYNTLTVTRNGLGPFSYALSTQFPDAVHADLLYMLWYAGFRGDLDSNNYMLSEATVARLATTSLVRCFDSGINWYKFSPRNMAIAMRVWRDTNQFYFADGTAKEILKNSKWPEEDRAVLLETVREFHWPRILSDVFCHALEQWFYGKGSPGWVHLTATTWARCYDSKISERDVYIFIGRELHYRDTSGYDMAALRHFADTSRMRGATRDLVMIADWEEVGREDWSCWRRQRACRILAMVVMLSDGLLQWREITLIDTVGRITEARRVAQIARYFRIALRLPLELQTVLALRTMRHGGMVIEHLPDYACHWVLGIWKRPPLVAPSTINVEPNAFDLGEEEMWHSDGDAE